jgi:3-oxosteroid 1-dehydrogenase
VARWGGFANRRNWDARELARREAQDWLAAGQGLVAQLLVAYLKLGGHLQLNAGATELVFSQGRVGGVRLHGQADAYEARHGVVLACGGYEGNPELVQRFEGLPDWLNPFAPTNQGDGMVMATEHGAAIYRSAVNHGLLVGCAIPTRNSGQPTGPSFLR